MLMVYRPHPFSWVPAGGLRHASAVKRPFGGWADGEVIAMLCGEEAQAENSPTAWFWETCPECNVQAHRLAGVPMAVRDDC
jgi:zinc finger protein